MPREEAGCIKEEDNIDESLRKICHFQQNVPHTEGAVASWLVPSTPERALRVRALAGDIVLCS